MSKPNTNEQTQQYKAQIKALKVENQRLQKELTRKEKALAEAAALMVLKKKASFTDGILTFTNTLVDNIVKSKCTKHSIQDAINLLSAIENIPKLDRHPKTYTKMLFFTFRSLRISSTINTSHRINRQSLQIPKASNDTDKTGEPSRFRCII
jgi:hypothetical protein